VKANPHSINRRLFLQRTGASALALSVLPGCATPQAASGKHRRALRVAHLTDVHVSHKPGAPEGMVAALLDLYTDGSVERQIVDYGPASPAEVKPEK
jgi:hypothetical protein